MIPLSISNQRSANRVSKIPSWFHIYESIPSDVKKQIIDLFVAKVGQPGKFEKFCRDILHVKVWNSKIAPLVQTALTRKFSVLGPQLSVMSVDLLVEKSRRQSLNMELLRLFSSLPPEMLEGCKGNYNESIRVAKLVQLPEEVVISDAFSNLVVSFFATQYLAEGAKVVDLNPNDIEEENQSLSHDVSDFVDSEPDGNVESVVQSEAKSAGYRHSEELSSETSSVNFNHTVIQDSDVFPQILRVLSLIPFDSHEWADFDSFIADAREIFDARNSQFAEQSRALLQRKETTTRLLSTSDTLSAKVNLDFLDYALESASIMRRLAHDVVSNLSIDKLGELSVSLTTLDIKLKALQENITTAKQRRMVTGEVDEYLETWIEVWRSEVNETVSTDTSPDNGIVSAADNYERNFEALDSTSDETILKTLPEVVPNESIVSTIVGQSTDESYNEVGIHDCQPELSNLNESQEILSNSDTQSGIEHQELSDSDVSKSTDFSDGFIEDGILEVSKVESESRQPYSGSDETVELSLCSLFDSGRVRVGCNYAAHFNVAPETFGCTPVVDLLVSVSLLGGPTSILNETIKLGLEAVSLLEDEVTNPSIRTLLWTSLIIPSLIGRSDVRHLARPLLDKFVPNDSKLRSISHAISDFVLRTNVINKSDFAKSPSDLRQQRLRELSADSIALKSKLKTKVIKYAAGSRVINASVTGTGVLGLVLDGIAENSKDQVERASKLIGRPVVSMTSEEWLDTLWTRYKRSTDRPIEGGPRDDCKKLLSDVQVLVDEWRILNQSMPSAVSNTLINDLRREISSCGLKLPLKSQSLEEKSVWILANSIWTSICRLVIGENQSITDPAVFMLEQDQILFDYSRSENVNLPLSRDEIREFLVGIVDNRSLDEYKLRDCVQFLSSIDIIPQTDVDSLFGRLDFDRSQYKSELTSTCIHLIANAGTSKATDQLDESEYIEISNELNYVKEQLESSNGMSTVAAAGRILPCKVRLDEADRKFRNELVDHELYKELDFETRQIVDAAMEQRNYASVFELLHNGNLESIRNQRDDLQWHLPLFLSFLSSLRPDILELISPRDIQGERDAVIHFPRLARDIVNRRIAVLQSWKSLKRNIDFESDIESDLTNTLSFLGLDDVQLTVDRNASARTRYVKFRPTLDRKNCPNPQFGSRICSADGMATYRIFGSWQVQDIAGVVNKLPDTPCILFYFNVLTKANRSQLLRVSRDRRTTPIVIDTALLVYFLTLPPNEVRRAFYECVTPFSPQNPYHLQGFVPVEMFYGRSEAIKSIQRGNVSLVYGGRQLGKTALLQRVKELQSKFPFQIAAYVDLKHAGVGTTLSFEDFDQVIIDVLKLEGQPKGLRIHGSNWDRGIRKWLAESGDVHREVTLLLDEADVFLDEDDRRGFIYTQKFRQLMNDTNKQFKVVFAGLHNVLRMTTSPNHPFGQLGQPVCVGPLLDRNDSIEARELVKLPLQSVGIKITDDLVTEILAQTNWYPSLIQMYCHALVENKTLKPSSLPIDVNHTDLKSVYDRDLRENIAIKFGLTLGLDIRYKYLTHIIAYLSLLTNKLLDGLDIHEIRTESQHHWGDDFDLQLGGNRLTNLLDELVGLGVLRKTHGKYALRTTNITALLGGLQQIEHELSTFANTVYEFGVREDYYEDEGTRILDPIARWQYRELSRFDVKVVLGLPASGIYRVETMLPIRSGMQAGFTQANNLREFKRELDTAYLEDFDRVMLVVPHTVYWDESWVKYATERVAKLNSDRRPGVRRYQVLFVGTSKHELPSAYKMSSDGEWISPETYALAVLGATPRAAIAEAGDRETKSQTVWLDHKFAEFSSSTLRDEFELSPTQQSDLEKTLVDIQNLFGSRTHRMGILIENDGTLRTHPEVDDLIMKSLSS